LVHPLIIFGSKGFIGRHFARVYPEALALDHSAFDISVDPHFGFSTEGLQWALIAAGMSNPLKCEENPAKSYRCNVEGPLLLGKELLKRGILPIFFSTDYVFNDDLQIQPLNTYGKQKAELEEKGERLGALVIRLSKVYGVEKGDGTFFDQMAAQFICGQEIMAARDQIFAPIYIEDVLEQVMHLASQKARGVFQIAGPSFASRLEMALHLVEGLRMQRELVKEISLDDLRDGIKRPKRLRIIGSPKGLNWKNGIEKVIKAYEE
jgi:dTDP-4-dehydrorhamnose reductase